MADDCPLLDSRPCSCALAVVLLPVIAAVTLLLALAYTIGEFFFAH